MNYLCPNLSYVVLNPLYSGSASIFEFFAQIKSVFFREMAAYKRNRSLKRTITLRQNETRFFFREIAASNIIMP